MRRIAALATGLALVLASVPALIVAAPAAPAGARAARPNLIVNPGAETGLCTTSGYDAMTVPGWTAGTGSPDSVCYGSIGFPRSTIPGPPGRGRAFFAGGATGDATLTQRVPLAAGARLIDEGDATYDLSGWLGGFAGQNDRVGITARFVDRAGRDLAETALDPVTNSGRDMMTQLIDVHRTGSIPARARAVLVTLRFTWTAGDTTDGYADDLSFTTNTPVVPAKLRPPASIVPDFDHVFVVAMANENDLRGEAPAGGGDYVPGNPDATYVNGVLAYNSARLARMYATTHPIDVNGLAISGGSGFGWTRDPTAGTDRIDARHLGDELDAAGLTWTGYAEGMTGACDTTSHDTAGGGYYRGDGEPFMLYDDVASDPVRCAIHDQPLSAFPADLASAATTPAFAWLAPNAVNSMGSGSVRAGDAWLARTLPRIYASPAWTGSRSLLIVVWSEGYRDDFGPDYPNHVPAYIAASQGLVKDGYTSTVRYTDYSLAATIEHALGIGPLTSNDRYALPLNDIWTSTGSGAGAAPGSNL